VVLVLVLVLLLLVLVLLVLLLMLLLLAWVGPKMNERILVHVSIWVQGESATNSFDQTILQLATKGVLVLPPTFPEGSSSSLYLFDCSLNCRYQTASTPPTPSKYMRAITYIVAGEEVERERERGGG
jgi:hypothetical protein